MTRRHSLRSWGFLGAAICSWLTVAAADPQSPQHAFDAARQLQQAGREQEAFLAWAAIPGATQVAVRLARPQADVYLALLQKKGQDLPAALAQLIEGDLRLAKRDKLGALACYRAVSERIAAKHHEGWATGQVPRDAYLVEPPSDPQQPLRDALLEPFTAGPGSHRDNWLIRRFLALEAWDDAGREFARLWELHRGRAEPYLVEVPVRPQGAAWVREWRLICPAGFDRRGLQFALDYAFFLRKTNRDELAFAVLREPLLRIDLDHNPSRVTLLPMPPGGAGKYPIRHQDSSGRTFFDAGYTVGTSRVEYLRLAYGVFKSAGREAELIAALQQGIDGEANRLRRVLARVRADQGRHDEALQLELAFLQDADFDELSKVFRRGLVYEDARQLQEAAECYERALVLPYAPLTLPDSDEAAGDASLMQQRVVAQPVPDAAAGQASFQADVIHRLQRLYGALAKPERVFELSQRQFATNPALFGSQNEVEQLLARAQALGRDAATRDWLKQQAATLAAPAARANIFWVLKDYPACAAALAEAWKAGGQANSQNFEAWREQFRRVGAQELRLFLTTILQVDPHNARVRLELLDTEARFRGPDVIAALESLLEVDAQFAFARGKGDYNRTQFRSAFDLAYRLLRLYERDQQLDKLRALGLRIAAGEKPFGTWWTQDLSTHAYRDENQLPEDLNACLAVLLQYADAPTLERLANLWKDRGDFPAARQLARRRAGTLVGRADGQDVGWANLPTGVRAIVSHETVLALARDAEHLYAGHPWGVAVYRLDGTPVTRIALTEAVKALAVGSGYVWAGTPKGLFRIEAGTWHVTHIWLHGDRPEKDRHTRSFPGAANYWFDNGVYTLALDGDELWIGLHRNVQRLQTRTLALRAYSYRELKLDSWGGFDRLLLDGEYVWAGNREVLRRYDRATDTWQAVELAGRGVGLIGRLDGQLFGHAWVDERLRDRPCLIDRPTLTITPLQIEGDSSVTERMANGPFACYGKYQGQLVFGDGGPSYVLDPARQRLVPLALGDKTPQDVIESPLPPPLRGGPIWWADDPYAAPPDPAGPVRTVEARHVGHGGATLLVSTDGLRAFNRLSSYTPRYEYPQEDWPFRDIFWDTQRDECGLYLWGADHQERRISSFPATDTLAGDTVFAIVPDPQRSVQWLCTNLGVAALDGDGRVVHRFAREEGLCANRVTAGAVLGDKLYFSTGWGDHGGGLAVADPATAVFTALFQSDGLATDKLARVEPREEELRLVYDVEYGRGGRQYEYRHFPAGRFQPASGQITPGGAPEHVNQTQAHKILADQSPPTGRPLPYLGGFVIQRQTIGDKTYLCGTRGLVIVGNEAPPEMRIEELGCSVVVDPHVRLEQESQQLTISIQTAADLARWIAHENPFVRQRALALVPISAEKNSRVFIPLLVQALSDVHVPNRLLAVQALGRTQDVSAVPSLEQRLGIEAERTVCQAIALTLARQGKLPDLKWFEQLLLQNERSHGSDNIEVVQALAPHATAEVFALLLKYPLVADTYEPRQTAFRTLGTSLKKQPPAVSLLLQAYAADDPGPESNYGPTRFAQEVFKFAGPDLLPALHQALASPERVIRSNAARACGAIGDRSSVPHLIQALDLESGLSRASIVWALGQLRAAEALPRLAALYLDARNDEKRGRGAGFRASQAQAEMRAQYENLSHLEAIGGEWDDLKAAARPQPVDPRRHEPLLTTAGILAAVRKIGAESSQAFYRQLAAEKDADVRREAAERLAEAGPDEQARSLPVLRNLLSDEQVAVRINAAVSLLILGERDVQTLLQGWLATDEGWAADETVAQLARVQDGRLLVFARPALQRLADQPKRRASGDDRIRVLLQRIAK